jgi:hypothetical protein
MNLFQMIVAFCLMSLRTLIAAAALLRDRFIPAPLRDPWSDGTSYQSKLWQTESPPLSKTVYRKTELKQPQRSLFFCPNLECLEGRIVLDAIYGAVKK